MSMDVYNAAAAQNLLLYYSQNIEFLRAREGRALPLARTHTNKYERSDPYCSKDFNCQTTLPIIITKRIMKKNYLMMLLLHIYLKIYKTDIVNSIFHCSNSLTNQ